MNRMVQCTLQRKNRTAHVSTVTFIFVEFVLVLVYLMILKSYDENRERERERNNCGGRKINEHFRNQIKIDPNLLSWFNQFKD